MSPRFQWISSNSSRKSLDVWSSFSFIEAKIYIYSVRVKVLWDFCAYFVFKINPHLIRLKTIFLLRIKLYLTLQSELSGKSYRTLCGTWPGCMSSAILARTISELYQRHINRDGIRFSRNDFTLDVQ
jgi:hypothetical protein